MPHPIGSEKCEKRSLPERCKATEGAVRGVGLPAGSENREILSLLDVIPINGRLDKLDDRIILHQRGATSSTTTQRWRGRWVSRAYWTAKPAGTIWIGVSGPNGTVTERKQYRNDRKRNIERFAASALDLLRSYIEKA